MENRLYVGNLSYDTSEQELRREFEKCGNVTDVKIVIDRESGRSRGFGFVQYSTSAEATEALNVMNGSHLGGRTLTVKIAEQRQSRPGGGGPRNYNSAPQAPYGGGGNRGGGGYQGGGGGRGGGGGGRDKGRRRRDRDDNDWG